MSERFARSGIAKERENQLLSKLETWQAAQSEPPTIFDVLATRDVELFGAFVLRAFRAAARAAVEETRRVERVRAVILDQFGGDTVAAETFLRARRAELEGRTPLETIVASEIGAAAVVELASQLRGDA